MLSTPSINTHHIRPAELLCWFNLKEKPMDEVLTYYENRGIPVPLDIQVRAVETYGYIIVNNYPLEDDIHDEEA